MRCLQYALLYVICRSDTVDDFDEELVRWRTVISCELEAMGERFAKIMNCLRCDRNLSS